MTAITREDLLTAYAAGTTSPGLSLLCATHLTMAPEAREHVAVAEAVGGALLAAEDTSGVPPMDFERLLARLDEVDGLEAAEDGDLETPAPLARALGGRLSDVAWRFRLPGIHEYVVEGFDAEKVSLLKARPGAKIPQHTHEGDEATLVIVGALRDGDALLRPGDLALAGPDDDHHPEIVGDEICVCLVVTNGALRFTGTFGRALNLFAE